MQTSNPQNIAANRAADCRAALRQLSEGHATVRVAMSDDPQLVGQSLRCSVLDISESGLRLETSAMLPGDSKLAIWVSPNHAGRRFFLRGEVRWVSFEENGEFNVGVELSPEAATEYTSWVQFVSAPVLTDKVELAVVN